MTIDGRYNWDKIFGVLKIQEVTERGYVYLEGKGMKVSFFLADLDFYLDNPARTINFVAIGTPISFSELNKEQKISLLHYFKVKLLHISVPEEGENTERKLRELGVIQ